MDGLREECEAQKLRADEMKQIIITRLKTLESKVSNEQSMKIADSTAEIQ